MDPNDLSRLNAEDVKANLLLFTSMIALSSTSETNPNILEEHNFHST